MSTNKPKLLSGRVPVVPYDQLSTDRYQFLGLGQAEPSLGAGANSTVLTITTNNTRSWSNSLSLTGNIAGDYILGNGSQLTGINASSNKIFNGNSYANIATADGNLVVGINGPEWTFDTTGTLTTPGAIYGPADSFFNIAVTDSGPGAVLQLGDWDIAGFPKSLVQVSDNVTIVTGVTTGGGSWTFDTNGTLTAPGNISTTGNITADYYFGNGFYLTGIIPPTNILNQTVEGNNVANTFTLLQSASANTVLVTINGITQTPDTDYAVTGNTITFSTAPYNGDVVQIRFLAVAGPGGGGNANTGNVTFDNINIIGTGNLHLQPDPNNSGAYLDIYLTTGPDIHIAKTDSNVILGSDTSANVTVGTNGNVYVQANTGTAYTWAFDSTGNLTLPNSSNFGDAAITQTDTNTSGVNSSTGTFPYLNYNINLVGYKVNGPGVTNATVASQDQGTSTIVITGGVFQAGQAYQFSTAFGTVGTALEVDGSTWIFGFDGSTTLPGNVSVAGNILATGFLTGVASLTGNTLSGDGALYAGISLFTHLPSDVIAQFSSNANSYSQINFQNIDPGIASTTDYIATADNGSDTAHFIDMGIAGGSYVPGSYNSLGNSLKSNDGYVYVQGSGTGQTGNLVIGTNEANGVVRIIANGSNTANIVAEFSKTGISAAGNIRGAYILGDGSQLTGVSGGVIQSNTAPANPTSSTLWWDEVTGTLYVWYDDGNSTQWVAAAPAGSFTLAGNLQGNLSANGYGINNLTTLSVNGNIRGNYILGNGSQLTGIVASYGNANVVANLAALGSNPISTAGNVTGNYILGNGSQLTGITANYSNSNVATFLAAYGSNTISTSGNITAGNLIGNINITGNVTGTSANVQLVAGSYTYTFDNTGNFTLPANSDIIMTGVNSILSAGGTALLGGYTQVGGSYSTLGVKYPGAGTQFGMTLQPTNDNTTAIQFLNAAGNSVGKIDQTSSTVKFIGDGSSLTNVATKSSGSWTLATGTNTVSFTVTAGQTYTMWVSGNIPNGIVVWNATATLTNTNVPVIGVQYGWYYAAGNALVLTSIPSQIIGISSGGISNASPAVANTNVFTFGITNNSGSSQTVYYGWTQIS